uniref:DPP IV N-terminal domain-containing protein n=1 Tax=Metallibacterium sp. TaxID=2940281 RepID=UPI00262B48DD
MRLTTALLFAALLGMTAPAMAEKLSIDRIYDSPSLSGPTVMGLKIAPDGARVTFLRGSSDDQYRMDLWEYDRKDGALKLLVAAATLEPHGEHLDAAERARRERERTAMYSGILDYHWAPDGKAILFPLNGKLYLYRLGVPAQQAIEQLPIGAGFALDPKISPKGRYVSFIREQNLWVYDLKTGKLRELTNDDGTIHDGEAEFVAQEELDRHTGYWWAPDDSAIAFERYNDAPVPEAE